MRIFMLIALMLSAFPVLAEEAKTATEHIARGAPPAGIGFFLSFFVLIALYGGGIVKILQWMHKNRGLPVPAHLQQRALLLKGMQYASFALGFLSLMHFRIWTLCIATVCVAVTILMQKQFAAATASQANSKK